MSRASRLALAAFLTIGLTACDFAPSQTGRVGLSVQWPGKQAKFRVLAIPPETARIDVEIRGEGIPETAPVRDSLTPGGPNAKEIPEIPIGPKYVQAVAIDANNKALAIAAVTIVVEANKVTDAELVLQAIPDIDDDPLPTPSPTPSGSPDPNGPSPSPSVSVAPEPQLTIATVAGDGEAGAIDAADAFAARLYHPRSLAYDRERQVLYIADTQYKLIRRYDLVGGGLSTIAGAAAANGEPPRGLPPAIATGVSGVPGGMAVGPDGDLYFCDRDNHMIRRITAGGEIETVAGTGRPGYLDGVGRQAQFNFPSGLSIDKLGNIYVADTANHRVRRITGGRVTTVVGAGAGAANLDQPTDVAVEPFGRFFYVAEPSLRRVQRYTLDDGRIESVAGSGAVGFEGEGGPARLAALGLPTALALDANNDLYIADGWALKLRPGDDAAGTLTGAAGRVLKLTADGRLVRVAGANVTPNFGGDGGDALQAVLNNPGGLAIDAAGRIFVADSYNNRIRVLRPAPLATPIPSPSPSPEASATPGATPAATPTPVASPS